MSIFIVEHEVKGYPIVDETIVVWKTLTLSCLKNQNIMGL